MNTVFKLDNQAKENLLARLAKEGLMKRKLVSVDSSGIYAVSEGWQLSYLKGAREVTETLDSEAFEAAAQNPDISAIVVPKAAAMTREIAERILDRSGQLKTVFWEV